VCRRIGVFDPLDDLTGKSYTASEFEELPAVQQAVAIRKLALFSRHVPRVTLELPLTFCTWA
jgi:Ca2+ transporting ATPase